ncbi:sensor domain-containing diguanylate cyclase [Hahella ganghwensis]|uniref:sensor domain-containing diguanylate cyclase n=1 Tax=Hahella ganghwensis TaxID=286420 RepID=UPI00037C3EE8|nr:GAF domain-containing protein [Hahella ganghwensis]
MYQTLINALPFTDFEVACRAVLAFLHDRLGFDMWMMTRANGEDWIILQTEDYSYYIEEGTTLKWTDSFCSLMMENKGPRVAPCSRDIEAYVKAPIARQMNIGAYFGVPVLQEDGRLFGTLCAIDPEPQPQSIEAELPLVELLASLLGSILSKELKALDQERRFKLTLSVDLMDETTTLPNRRAWDQAVAREEYIASRYGSPICVAALEIVQKGVESQNGNPAYVSQARSVAFSLQKTLPSSAFIAKVGEGVFGVLMPEYSRAMASPILERSVEALQLEGIPMRYGMSMRRSEEGVSQAFMEAVKAKN